MSKPVKALLRKEMVKRLTGLESLAVLSLAGIDGVATNQLRRDLRDKDIRLAVVKNSVVKEALKEAGLERACTLIQGPCALAYGGESVVVTIRELLKHGKELPSLAVKGAVMEGEVYGPDRVEQLGNYPTRPEALAKLAGLALSPGSRVSAAMTGPGQLLAGVLRSLAERGEDPQAA